MDSAEWACFELLDPAIPLFADGRHPAGDTLYALRLVLNKLPTDNARFIALGAVVALECEVAECAVAVLADLVFDLFVHTLVECELD